MVTPQPYKIVDQTGLKRFGIVVDSLDGLIKKAQEKFGFTSGMKVVIEQDGTEVDEEEYFLTLEENTSFVILGPDQEWIPPSEYNYINLTTEKGFRRGENVDDDIEKSYLGDENLDILSDINPDNLDDIIPENSDFLKEVKAGTYRYFSDKQLTQEALHLLKMYHTASSSMLDCGTYARAVSTGTSTSDIE